jgi:hypothetical protein
MPTLEALGAGQTLNILHIDTFASGDWLFATLW